MTLVNPSKIYGKFIFLVTLCCHLSLVITSVRVKLMRFFAILGVNLELEFNKWIVADQSLDESRDEIFEIFFKQFT